ncbi:MAG: Phage shock protein C, PspC [Berkelbacteria bacterium GW2011_GWA2_35_9]|uniref:Phage shock protein C, PspC n=1 Tax=Berkelbacteria bacterium GW2011_GWA2_35_9 TaxID=1618333 RepID=A0A0G0GAK6_9BACT|nr:MAG: Phage shock protein C, PspC [Berkelbacteria bacterium GW2011_GWA2_35_9]
MENKLFRSKSDKIIAGVCGGVAEYFKIDPIAVRVAFVILAFVNGYGFVLYLILAILLPENGTIKKDNTQEIKNKLPIKKFGDFRDILAVVLILIGVISLAQQIFPSFWISIKLFYSIIIIGLGLYLVIKD